MAWTSSTAPGRACLQPCRSCAPAALRPSVCLRVCHRRAAAPAWRAAQRRHAEPRRWCCAQADTATTATSQAERPSGEGALQEAQPDQDGELGRRIEVLAAEVRGRLEGTSVYLVGMMGSGKSTVGRLVGGALKYPFLDTDALIEASAGCTIPDIFRDEGEEAFRDLETQVLQELMPFKEVVVATGGGAVVRGVNWGYLHHGIVVWLAGAPELLAARAMRDGAAQRPMLAQAGGAPQGGGYEAMLARVRELLEQRGERYAAADLHVSLAADAGGAPDAGAPAAVVAWRLLHELNERLKADAADREAASKAEVVITDAGVPPTMRVVPPAAAADMEGAAPAA